jgi:hypothetical protein
MNNSYIKAEIDIRLTPAMNHDTNIPKLEDREAELENDP